MKRILTFLVAVTVSTSAAAAQDVSLHSFSGWTAPAAQDANFFSRSYQGGVTLGAGAGISIAKQVVLEVNLSYQLFSLDSPAAVLENNGFDGAGATFHRAGPYHIFAQEMNVQYTFRHRWW